MDGSVKIEQLLSEKGVYVDTIVGVSMEPLLRTRRDVVIIEKNRGRLKENDVALYRRGESYVLHRVVRVLPEGYVILGDNCIRKEYGIMDSDILGVMTGFYRKGKHFSVDDPRYLRYVAFIRAFHPAIVAYNTLRRKAAGVWHKIKKQLPLCLHRGTNDRNGVKL